MNIYWSFWYRCCSVAMSSATLPGFSVCGISQARILAWVAISCSRSSWPRNQAHISCFSRQILYHWATREAVPPAVPLFKIYFNFHSDVHLLALIWGQTVPDLSKAISMFHSPAKRNGSRQACDHTHLNQRESQILWWKHLISLVL